MFMDVVKVVDGIANCFICVQKTPLKRFAFVLDEHNYVKSMQYYSSGLMYFPYNCIQNDHIFQDSFFKKKKLR